MAYLVINDQADEHKNEFESFLSNQELIGDINLYEHYNNDCFYEDICDAIKNDPHHQIKSHLREVI